MFAFVAESVHENTPYFDIELLIKKLLENFIAEGYTEEKITMGINMIRLILLWNNNALSADDLNYVAKFWSYKNKNVSTAAKSLINTAWDVCPDLLDKEF